MPNTRRKIIFPRDCKTAIELVVHQPGAAMRRNSLVMALCATARIGPEDSAIDLGDAIQIGYNIVRVADAILEAEYLASHRKHLLVPHNPKKRRVSQ